MQNHEDDVLGDPDIPTDTDDESQPEEITEDLEKHLNNSLINLAKNLRLQKLADKKDPKRQRTIKVVSAYLKSFDEHPEQQKGRHFKMAA